MKSRSEARDLAHRSRFRFGSGDCPTMYLAWRRIEVDAELRGLR